MQGEPAAAEELTSGIETVQETVSRIMARKGVDRDILRDGRLIISDEVPDAADPRRQDALAEFITESKLEVLAIDPAYFSLPCGDNGNLFKQGAVMKMLGTACRQAGASLRLRVSRGAGKSTQKKGGLKTYDLVVEAGRVSRHWRLLARDVLDSDWLYRAKSLVGWA
jgi:hypothetical protein